MKESKDCLSNALEETRKFLGYSSKETHKKSYNESDLLFENECFEKSISQYLESRPESEYSFLPGLGKMPKKESENYIGMSDPCKNKNLDLLKNEEIISYFCDGFLNQPYSLSLLEEFDHITYKDKTISLKANIVDALNNKVTLKKPLLFTALLLKAVNPIQIVELTKFNEKIITGTAICQITDTVYFKKLMIREVSSYQPFGIFNLIILPDDAKLIKPLVIGSLKVKSRKSKLWKLKKKLKINE
ncbi:hypothetical protein SteCoe_34063 [Stentor coeruleus]|uniref:Uncharacterized protein n=1 Tax=Stentor coeruleus TaxID=5963 RepID=A0A1R2AVQ5_9CILI|nr:hypothetical protein SteCoe_34063 [Stentor coeruleus]